MHFFNFVNLIIYIRIYMNEFDFFLSITIDLNSFFYLKYY